jgi:hypothetical protein
MIALAWFAYVYSYKGNKELRRSAKWLASTRANTRHGR